MKAREPLDPWHTREDGSLLLGTVLWLVDRLRVPLRAAGVDFPIFRELMRTRVLMDLRPSGPRSKWGAVGVVMVVLMTWMVGLGTGLTAVVSGDTELWLIVSQSALFVLLLFFLFQQMAGVLVDPTDIRVLAPYPVPDRTLFAVRLTLVFSYLAILAASFTAGNVLLAVFKQPVLPVLFVYPLLSCLCTLTALGAVTLIFGVLLRLVGPTHFQRVSLWVQVGSAVVLVAVMQIGPRLVEHERLAELWDSLSAWRLLWPPVAYARTFAFAAGEHSSANLFALLCALTLPALALLVTLKLASRHYIAGLEGSLELGRGTRAPWARGLFTRLGPLLARGREQRAGFDFALALTRRETHVLRGALPQFASFQVMSLSMGLGSMRHGTGYYLCFSAGMLVAVLPTVLELSQGSASAEARWLFLAAPLEQESEVLRGALKGILLVWYGSALALVALAQLCVVGPGELAHIALALELSAALALVYTRLFALGIPFTQAVRKMENMANLGLVLTLFFALALLLGVHTLLSLHPLSLALGIVAAAGLIVYLWRGLDTVKLSAARGLAPTSEKAAGAAGGS